MEFTENTAVAESENTGEFAESPVNDSNELSENTLDTANPDSTVEEKDTEGVQDSETNAAFARMRRESEQAKAEADAAKRELEEIKALNSAREEAVSRLTGSDNGEISALAELTGLSEDEIASEMQSAREMAEKDLKISQLESRIGSIEADKLMQADLMAIQKIDPSIKSLDDLGEGYLNYIAAGLDAEDAYWACKAKEQANTPKPPDVVAGAVKSTAVEKEYFTEAEIDAMSPEQQKANWKKIMASWER